jgi:putative ubiquitin-RnfH superfamily antitoxin RatB of RatAB toxin-antitoxin module
MTGQDTQQGIRVEVVLAMPARQELVVLEVAVGTTLAEAITLSGLPEMFEDFELDLTNVGIFGHKASPEQVLLAGDRVEIYRPLIADPKEVRRQRALAQTKS